MKHVLAILAVLVMSTAPVAAQETITLAWDPSPEADVSGYTLYSGTRPGTYTSSQWVGNVTQRTMTIPPGTYYFVVRAVNVYGMQSQPSVEIAAEIATQPPPIPNWQAMWQNVNSGQIVRWDMFRGAYVEGGPLGAGQAETAWKLRTSGDFNGDGHKDLIFQHDQGLIAVWLLNGNGLLEARVINQMSDTQWEIAAAADFNSDGHTDILFQHRQSGNLVVWQMNRLTLARGVAVNPGRVADVNWRIVGVGDFNNDSSPDLVWQHVVTGVITTWLMNGTTLASAGPFSLTNSSDPNWRIKGVADVDDDGDADLLWQHATSNHIAVWYMSGRTFVDARLMTPEQVPSGWVLIGSR